MKKRIASIVLAAACALSLGACGTTTTSTSTTTSSTISKTASSTEVTPTPTPASQHFEATIGAGNYIAGKDIPVGTYNLTAVSGSGNVSSTNMYSGGLNEVMGTSDPSIDNASFNGAKLDKDVRLTIGGTVSVKIVSDDAKTGEVVARSGASGDEITLSSGNYTAGQQFPVGTYNIAAVSGNRNVSSSNLYDGGINEVMSPDASDGISISAFCNCELPKDATLQLSNCVTVKLTPVGQ